MNPKAFAVLRAVISFSLIAFLVWIMRGSVAEISAVLKNADIYLYGLSVAITLSLTIPMGYRLKIILGAQGISLLLRDTIYLSFIGYFFNNFLPTAIGGDMVKAYYAGKSTKKNMNSFASIFMDRFIGLFSFASLAAVILIFKFRKLSPRISAAILAIFAASLLIGFVLLNKDIGRRLFLRKNLLENFRLFDRFKRLYRAMNNYRNHKPLLLKGFIISLLAQSASIFALYLFSRSIYTELSLMDIFIFMPIIATISILPSINGLGIREGAMVYFFSPFIGREKAFVLSLLWLSGLIALSLVGGVIYALNKHHHIKEVK